MRCGTASRGMPRSRRLGVEMLGFVDQVDGGRRELRLADGRRSSSRRAISWRGRRGFTGPPG